jgi:hypothetical protein
MDLRLGEQPLWVTDNFRTSCAAVFSKKTPCISSRIELAQRAILRTDLRMSVRSIQVRPSQNPRWQKQGGGRAEIQVR